MPRHHPRSIALKRQVGQEFVAGETLHGLAKRHDISRHLIRVWAAKFETGVFDAAARAADLIQENEASIAALDRAHGRTPGARDRVFKRGAEKRTTAEKRITTERRDDTVLIPTEVARDSGMMSRTIPI